MNIRRLKSEYQSGNLTKPEYIRQSLERHIQLFEYVDVIHETDVREIRITADGVSFLLGDEAIRIYCPHNEARVVPIEIMNFGRYESEETRIMDLLTSRASTILDVGANIGWYSIRFAKQHPNAHIYAFEPLPISYGYLQRNLAANEVGSRVATFNYGLSDRNGMVEFFIAPTNGTNASLLNVASASDAQRVVGLTLTLDTWVENQCVRPDFIKCDVEGAELLVFRGGLQTLTQHRPVVFAELLRKWAKPFGYHPNDMLQYFRELGYCGLAVGRTGVRLLDVVTDETEETNYAFLHHQAHASLLELLGVTV